LETLIKNSWGFCKMSQFLLVFLAVTVAGCASFFGGKSRTSKWETLNDAGSVACKAWPSHPRILSLQSLRVLPGEKTGFLATVSRRSGAATEFYGEFNGGPEVEASSIGEREFGTRAIIAGGGSIKGKVHAVIIPTAKNAGSVEVRSMSDNVVRFSGKNLDTDIKSAKTYFTKKGIWVLYRAGSDEDSVEDLRSRLAYLEFDGQKPELKVHANRGNEFPADAELVFTGYGQKAIVVWIEQQKAKTGNVIWLKMQEIDAERQIATTVKTIRLPINAEAESWRVVGFREGVLVALVDGDSLVGQANLRVSLVEWVDGLAALKWVKEVSLLNEHVSIPIWAVAKRKAYLLLPKWVDEESTIATYRVGPDGIEDVGAAGIFKKGSRIMETFIDEEDQDVYTIVRGRGKFGWQFDICHLEDLD